MHSGSIASNTTKSLPTKKLLVDNIWVKMEPFSPDHSSLHEALRVGGAADLDTSLCKFFLVVHHGFINCWLVVVLKNAIYLSDFYPISMVSIKQILKSPNHYKFDLDPKKNVTTLLTY